MHFVAERISAKSRGMCLAGRYRIELCGEGAGIVLSLTVTICSKSHVRSIGGLL
jgi:hypothetical protein